MIPLSEIRDEVLTWTRPSFLELRYELAGPNGVAARVSVSGMGDSKHARAETAEGAWQFAVFPFSADEVIITRASDQVEEGRYRRTAPFEIDLVGGSRYRLNPVDGSNSRLRLEDHTGHTIFEVEQIEAFPRWKAEVKVDPAMLANRELPVLLVWACCVRVFR